MPLTRRTVLTAMAKLGGAGAIAETLAAWDFLKPPPAQAATLTLAPDSGKGRTVAILGAGVSGLCAAYELDRAGYDCIVLEPQRRAGGRSLTLRRGDTLRETSDSELQTCGFDEGLWLNAGPGRIPHSHVHVIDYCRRFGVALQPYIFASRANLVYSNTLGNGRAVQVRQALHDLHGHIAELADKCIAKGGLDLPVTGTELEKLREMLAQFGDLTRTTSPGNAPSFSYQNQSGRAGYEILPGTAYEAGRPLSPLKLEEILRSNVWNDWLFRDADYFWQTSLLEPVGGMDMFARGFLRQPLTRQAGTVDGLIRYGARVVAVDVGADKVDVLYRDRDAERALSADHCISTIPMPIFKTLKTNLPAAAMKAAADLPTMAAGKVGWQSERFWETNDNIYGGISWTTDTIDQIWYPSSGYLGAKGTLTGAYMRGRQAIAFDALPVAERLRLAREQGERLHPGFFAKSVEHGLAIGWDRMEFAQMGWANEGDPHFAENAQVLAKPQGRFHFAGDQITFWSGWQEGAVLAAWEAVQAIDRQANPTGNRG
jgi:monoamine oxidase